LAARKKSAVKKRIIPIPKAPEVTNEADSLREFAVEAEQVSLLKKHQGWQILQRDLNNYITGTALNLPYLVPNSKDFNEARILFIASDKILKMVEDYEENKKRALELLERIDNPDKHIVLDVDN